MIHLRPVPRNYDFALERLRAAVLEDLKREKMRKQAANDDISDWEKVRGAAVNFLHRPGGILGKREARLIQKQNYIQQGGN